MNKNKLFMVAGAIAIILFIIWFYFRELSLPERAYQESAFLLKSYILSAKGKGYDI